MIWVILLLATILRLININQSLWLDEAINVLAAKNNSLWSMITKYPIGDFHPPGWFFILWVWEKIGGSGEIWIRLPAVIFGVATIWVTYLLGKEMFSRKIALVGSLLLAVAPLHVYYSQEARMYSLATFSSVMSFYFFWKLLNNSNRGDLIGYTISAALVLYADYLAYLIFPAQLLYLSLWDRKSLKKVLVSLLISLVALIPWLFVFPKQLANGVAAAAVLPGWASVVGGSSLKELLLIPLKTFFGRVSVDNKIYYGLATLVVGLLYFFIGMKALKKLDNSTKLLICWIIIPVTLAFVISFYIPILSYFRIIFILPAFYILLAKGIDGLGTQARPGRLAMVGICLVSLISLTAYYINPKFQREDWERAVPFVESKLKSDSLVLLDDNGIFSPYAYYSNDLTKVAPGLKKIPAMSESDVKEIPLNIKEIYLFEYLVDITDPDRLLWQKLTKSGFSEAEVLNFNGVGLVRHFILQY